MTDKQWLTMQENVLFLANMTVDDEDVDSKYDLADYFMKAGLWLFTEPKDRKSKEWEEWYALMPKSKYKAKFLVGMMNTMEDIKRQFGITDEDLKEEEDGD